MKKNIFKMPQFWLATLLTVIPVVIGLFFYNRIPAELPIHFDTAFRPDSYGPKALVIFGFPCFFVVINAIVWFAVFNDPKGKNINRPLVLIATWMIPIIGCFSEFAILMYGLGVHFNFVTLLPGIMGIIFIVIGNYLPKCRQNYVAGFRTPWALNNKENWRKTNRLAGYLMVVIGFLLILCSFFFSQIFYLFVLFILLLAIIPYIYSYYLYKKGI